MVPFFIHAMYMVVYHPPQYTGNRWSGYTTNNKPWATSPRGQQIFVYSYRNTYIILHIYSGR